MPAPSDTVVDFACHLYPDAVVDEERTSGQFWTHLGSIPHSPAALRERMAAAGVDAAVLSMPSFMGSDDAPAVAAANDALRDVVRDNEEFYGLASIPTGAGGEAAAAELERALEAGLHGGAVETTPDCDVLTRPEAAPLLDVADDWGAPLLVHPKLHDSLGGALDETHFHNAVFGREAALAVSLANALYENVPNQYPDAALVFHHLGGNVASMLGRIEVHADAARWPFKDDLLPYETFERRLRDVYVDTAGHFDNRFALASAVDAFPETNVLFGTDTPFEARSASDTRAYLDAVSDVVECNEAERRVRGGNALSVLANVD